MRVLPVCLIAALSLAAMVAAPPAGTGGPGGSPPLPSLSDARPWREVLTPADGHTLTGDVRILAEFPIPQLGTKRRAWRLGESRSGSWSRKGAKLAKKIG